MQASVCTLSTKINLIYQIHRYDVGDFVLCLKFWSVIDQFRKYDGRKLMWNSSRPFRADRGCAFINRQGASHARNSTDPSGASSSIRVWPLPSNNASNSSMASITPNLKKSLDRSRQSMTIRFSTASLVVLFIFNRLIFRSTWKNIYPKIRTCHLLLTDL